jgi:TonB family protein
MGREGWVVLSYVVTSEGEIASPMIEDSSGGEEFEASALRMLEQWNYEPATLNGAPVDQSMVHRRVIFLLENGSGGASRSFRAYGEIQELSIAVVSRT